MYISPIEKAINEQVRGFSPMEGICNGSKGKPLTKDQIWSPRRRTETILNEMIDQEQTLSMEKPKSKKNGRKRRKRKRGPRVLVANYNRAT